MFSRLKQNGNEYHIISKKYFTPNPIKKDIIEKVFDFSYKMTFGKIGEHRDHRSGGQHSRKNGELFCNTFQGKLAEFNLYSYLNHNSIKISEPDIEKWKLGKWDDSDFDYNNYKISVKSAAFFSNLILLETKDWDNNATYIPNDCNYDFTILIRIKPDLKKIFKNNRIFYSDNETKDKVRKIVFNEAYEYDIPGFIDNGDLVKIINDGFVLPQKSLLNGKMEMDASNFYIQAGDLKPINELIPLLKLDK